MMRYNVSQLLKSNTGTARHYELHEDIRDLDPTIKPLTDLNGTVELIRTNDGILVRANLYTSVELTCSRCLTEFAMPVRFRIEEEFHPTIDILTGARLPQPEDVDPATQIDIHHILDLSEIVRQALTLTLPMVPICRTACKGLCPNCGQNWNEGDCDCTDEELDPRFAVLRKLLDE
ncbi:MAG TPA: DUF177 domain-containing protein [Anaerolineae bacterium]|nr:DUF177 domain-containing protein [Anaerolineae bacterium]